MGCCDGIAKIVLGLFNLALLLIGLVPLVFGIIAIASESTLTKVFQYIPGTEQITEIVDINELIKSSAIFLIILGAILFLIGVFGFCGACCNVKWMIYLYLILVIAILLAEIAIIILAVKFPDTFSRSAKDLMLKSLTDHTFYDMNVTASGTEDYSFSPPSEALSVAWHTLQFELKCCGANNLTDYGGAFTWIKRNSSALAPLTCCSHQSTSFPPTLESGIQPTCILHGSTQTEYNTQGCFDALLSAIVKSKVAIGVIAGILGIEVILIILSSVRINSIRKESKSE